MGIYSSTTSSAAHEEETNHSSAPELNKEETGRPLDVIIAGAGIGGLSAAIGLRESGHNVKIFEQSRFANEIGAAVFMAPNATAVLRRFGFEPETRGAVTCERCTALNSDGSMVYDWETIPTRELHSNPWVLLHRVDLHNKLKEMAVDPNRKGPPVEIHTSSRVLEVDTETATITLEDGTKHTGDVVIGADGVNSALRRVIVGDEYCENEPSGKRAFRFLVPTEKLRKNPATKIFAEHPGRLLIWLANDRRVVSYPCRYGTLINFVLICPDNEGNKTGTDWNNEAKIEDILEAYKEFEPAIQGLIHEIDPKDLKVWRLLDLPQLQTWVSGKVALLGDAAHPFLPHQGQGAAQALEDGVALSIVLPLGTKPEEINERLKLYEQIRYERASTVQEYTRQSGLDLDQQPWQDVRAFSSYNFNYDAHDAATKQFNEYLLRKNSTIYKRMPVNFGIFRNPRYDLSGKLRSTPTADFTHAEVTIITPKPYLDTILPTSQFRIDVPGTKAKVSFEYTKFSNPARWGEKGCSHFGVYIHDVVCKGKTEEVRGKFQLVSLVDQTHPLLPGGEEPGFSKVFATFEENYQDTTFFLGTGWEEKLFAYMEIRGLEETVQNSVAVNGESKDSAAVNGESKNVGILQYKYIPKTGAPGEADVEYPTFSPSNILVDTKIEKTFIGEKAALLFDKKPWVTSSALYHVAEGLERIKVSEVLESKLVMGKGRLVELEAQRRIVA
ncbi:hypothetical protein RUND412_007033 [Rhizina undulata]